MYIHLNLYIGFEITFSPYPAVTTPDAFNPCQAAPAALFVSSIAPLLRQTPLKKTLYDSG